MATNDTVSSPIPSTSRRKSLYVQDTSSPSLVENNDETERVNIRNEISASTSLSENINLNSTRKSLGLSFLSKVSSPEMQERITECIKLNAENKINVKNAFSLKMIDFMTYMVKRNDANMCNFQMASVSLDVSSTIYSYRVDGAHTDIMKMAGGFHKKENEGKNNNVDPENEEGKSQNDEKKKKKRSRHQVFSTVENLKGTVNTYKPALHIMGNKDTQSTDTLYLAMLPNHADTEFGLHFYNDVKLDTIEDKTREETIEVTNLTIKNFSDLNICSPLANFEFLKYSDDESKEDNDTQSNRDMENQFRFDLDASLPPDDEVCNNINYVNIQDDGEDIDVHVEAQRPVREIENLLEVISSNVMPTRSEYSFIPKSSNLHWAGPSHWKARNLTRIEEACQQRQVKKKKEVEVCFDDTVLERIAPKFTKSKRIKLSAATLKWTEKALILPLDVRYNITNATKLYLHPLNTVCTREEDSNVIHASDQMTDNNEHDSLYCPNLSNEDYEENKVNNGNECNVGDEDNPEEPLHFTGENLVAVPKLTNKVAIGYSTRAKKIDMRQLKKGIYKILDTNNNNRENESTENTEDTGNQEKDENQSKRFKEVYKELPRVLTPSNAEALSFPIGFLSLLHLANDINLELESSEEMTDIIVKKG